MGARSRTVDLALIVVVCIFALAASAGGILLTFQEARQDALEASALIDGTQSFPPTGKTIYSGEGNLWQSLFREPFETVVFMFRDGSLVMFSTHDAAVVDAPISILVDHLKKSGRSLADCLMVVHNHFTPVGFTPGDEAVYNYLKARGFRGVFGIYYTASGRFLGASDK